MITMFELAGKYLGMKEIAGHADHPLIVWWLSQCGLPNEHDETPWCSAFLNELARLLSLPRSRSAAARSWLRIGMEIPQPWIINALKGDVVILKRGDGAQPGADVIAAPGHVGLFAGWDGSTGVRLLAGNQGNSVSIAAFPAERILGIRRLAERLT